MAAGRKITVEFLGEDRSLSSTARKVEGTTGKLGGRLGKVGMIAGGALVAGFGAAALAMVSAGKAAAEDQASAAKLAQQLKNTAGASDAQVASTEKWITAQGKALGVADGELRPALSKLVTATGDVGEAQKLASLAMDVSAGSGKSLEAVSVAMAKAQNGNVGALGKLGIATKDASGKALSFEQIQKNLAKTFKGQAATAANTFEGKMGRLKIQFDEAKEALGSKLLPVAEKFVGWIVDSAIPAATRFAKFMRAKFGPVFATVSKLLKKFGKDGEQTSGKFGKIISSLKSIFGSLVSIVSSVVSIITTLWKRFGGTLTKYALSTFKNMVTIIGGALKVIAGIFKVIASVLKGDWKGAWDGIKKIVSGAWAIIKGVVSQGWAIIKALFTIGGKAIASIFRGLWSLLKSAVVAYFSFYKSTVSAGWSVIKGLFGNAITIIKTAFGGMWSALKNATGAAWTAIKAATGSGWSAIKGAFGDGASTLRNAVGSMWTAIKTAFSQGVSAAWTYISALPSKILGLAGTMLSAGRTLAGKLFEGLGNLVGRIAEVGKNAINAAIDTINRGAQKINDILPNYINLGFGITADLPNNPIPTIPRLYKGGIVKGSRFGTPIVAGDRNHAEAVVPLSGPHAPKLGGGDITIIVQGALDPDAVGKRIEQILAQRRRTTGRALSFV